MTPKSIPILKTLILLTILNLTQSLVPSPSQLVLQQDPDDPNPEYTQFLRACEARLTLTCSDQIVEHVFGKGELPKSCCSRLIDAGPDCHAALIDGENSLSADYGSDRKRVRIRGESLWRKCARSAPPPRDRDYPRLPDRRRRPRGEGFLEACARELTARCGDEVVYAIFEKHRRVGGDCCRRLVRMGRACHDALVEGLENLGEYEKEDEAAVRKKSDSVWKHCEDVVEEGASC